MFITANESNIHSRLKHYLVRLAADGIRASISIGFDGTKVPPVLTLSTLHRAIIGGATPHHFISVDDLTEEQVKSKLDKQSDIIRADEIKVAVISIQNAKKKKCPFFVLAGQPQTVNMPSSFNEFVTQACLSVCNELKEADLVSVAADGVGCDNKWVCQQLRGFLRGDNRHVGLIDTDHNAKNFRYQLLGGSSVVMMGNFIIDPELLRLARVEIDLWRVKDFASDLLVLKLASEKTINKLSQLDNEDSSCIAVLSVTLYFLRLRLYSVNAKVFGFRGRMTFMWSSMIWFTSLGYKSTLGTNQSNMLANRRNFVTETIAFIFLFVRKDIINPRYCTSEPNEHTFGGWRCEKREATTQECTEIEEK